jgi:hypothetical protein
MTVTTEVFHAKPSSNNRYDQLVDHWCVVNKRPFNHEAFGPILKGEPTHMNVSKYYTLEENSRLDRIGFMEKRITYQVGVVEELMNIIRVNVSQYLIRWGRKDDPNGDSLKIHTFMLRFITAYDTYVQSYGIPQIDTVKKGWLHMWDVPTYTAMIRDVDKHFLTMLDTSNDPYIWILAYIMWASKDLEYWHINFMSGTGVESNKDFNTFMSILSNLNSTSVVEPLFEECKIRTRQKLKQIVYAELANEELWIEGIVKKFYLTDPQRVRDANTDQIRSSLSDIQKSPRKSLRQIID